MTESIIYDLVQRVREFNDSIADDDNDSDCSSQDTETDLDYNERMSFIVDGMAQDLIDTLDRDFVWRAVETWFDEDALMRTDRDALVQEVLGEVLADLADEEQRERLVLRACLVDDYINNHWLE